jgi:hypothetical protein
LAAEAWTRTRFWNDTEGQDRTKEMEYWASVVKKAQKDNKNLKRGIIVAARTTTTLWLRTRYGQQKHI